MADTFLSFSISGVFTILSWYESVQWFYTVLKYEADAHWTIVACSMVMLWQRPSKFIR